MAHGRKGSEQSRCWPHATCEPRLFIYYKLFTDEPAHACRFGPIVLKNSKIAGLRKSRKCSALAISAAARRCRIDTRASDCFCGNSCGPSACGESDAPADLRIFSHQRKRTFSTQSVTSRSARAPKPTVSYRFTSDSLTSC
jgi:hypothetical protein